MSFDFMGKKVIVRKDPIPQQNPVILYGSMKERFTKKQFILNSPLWAHVGTVKAYPNGGRITLSTMAKDAEASLIGLVYTTEYRALELLVGLQVVIDPDGVWLHGVKIADRETSERVVFIPKAIEFCLSQWRYRPDKHDDWGFIRDTSGSPVARVVVQADDELLTRHRENRTDPCEGLGKRFAMFPEMAIELNRSFVGLCRELGYISVKERFPSLVRTMKTLNGEADDQ